MKQIRIPKISAPKIRAPKVGAPQIRAPRFVSNLYRDLRDRRMLIPAIALVVALIAVPVLLKKSSSSAPPPPAAPAADAGEQSAAEPAVVTSQVGVTDYRRRLEQLQSKDPFRRHFIGLPKSAKLSATSSGSSAVPSTAATSPTGLSSSSASDTSISGGTTASASTTSATSSGSGSGSSSGSAAQKPASPTLYSFRVSVAVGPAGDLTERDNVKRTAYLPGKKRPLVSFTGVSEDAKHAIFAVSKDVSSVRGDGRCFPGRGNCNFLQLKPGDKASLDYAPEGDRRYNLKLREIKLVPVSKHRGGSSNKIGSEPLLGPDG